MEWDKKGEMVKLGNQRDKSPEAMSEFRKYVTDNISEFDIQAFDMLLNLIDLVPEEMREAKDFYSVVYSKSKELNIDDFGLRGGMRFALLQTICEDELNLS